MATSEDADAERFVLHWRQSDGTWRVLTESEFTLDTIRPRTPMRPRTRDECARWRAHALLPAELAVVEVGDPTPR